MQTAPADIFRHNLVHQAECSNTHNDDDDDTQKRLHALNKYAFQTNPEAQTHDLDKYAA
jgi:hypothetical protein